MNKTYLVSMDTIKTICQGALGGLTFGAYHMVVTNRIIDDNEKHHRVEMDLWKKQQQNEIDDLKEQIKEIKRKRWWS